MSLSHEGTGGGKGRRVVRVWGNPLDDSVAKCGSTRPSGESGLGFERQVECASGRWREPGREAGGRLSPLSAIMPPGVSGPGVVALDPRRSQVHTLRAVREGAGRWAVAGLAALTVPFLVTGIGRALLLLPTPLRLPGAAALLALFIVAVAGASRRGRARAVGVGLAIGTAVYAVFLFWLLSTVGRGMQQFD